MNLDDNVTIAQIAKVREKLSNGEEEIENIDDIPEPEPVISEEVIEKEITFPKEETEE